MPQRAGVTLEQFVRFGDGFLPGLLGVRIVALDRAIALFRCTQMVLWPRAA